MNEDALLSEESTVILARNRNRLVDVVLVLGEEEKINEGIRSRT